MEQNFNGELIAEKAREFIGQQEIKGNMGFKNSWFDKLMRSIGFRDTHAWCVYFCELVWTEFYKENDPRKLKDLEDIFTAGAVRTLRRFKEHPRWEVSDKAELGDIAIFQYYKRGKATQNGHAAIVTGGSSEVLFETIEGNTNNKGGREGYIVAKKIRSSNNKPTNGLRVIGFVKPRAIKISDH